MRRIAHSQLGRTVVNADSGEEKCVVLQHCTLEFPPREFVQPSAVDVKAVRMMSCWQPADGEPVKDRFKR